MVEEALSICVAPSQIPFVVSLPFEAPATATPSMYALSHSAVFGELTEQTVFAYVRRLGKVSVPLA